MKNFQACKIKKINEKFPSMQNQINHEQFPSMLNKKKDNEKFPSMQNQKNSWKISQHAK